MLCKFEQYLGVHAPSRPWHNALSVPSMCALKDKGSPGSITEIDHAPHAHERNEQQFLILVSTARTKTEAPMLFQLVKAEEVFREISNSKTLF